MRHVRMLGLCVIAAFALGAVAAASASASLPEFGTCREAVFGKYKDAGCTEPVADRYTNEGKYEWYSGKHYVSPKGTVRSFEHFHLEVELGPTSFETETGKTISCTEGRGEYILGTSKTLRPGESWLELTGCESEGKECKGTLGYSDGPGQMEDLLFVEYENPETGEIEPDALKGKFGFIHAPTEVGLDLAPSSKKEKHESMFIAECEGSLAVVYIGGSKHGGNSIISKIEPLNQMTSSFTQEFSGSGGVQNPLSFEGKKEDVLQEQIHGVWESSAWNGTETLEPEVPTELKTIP